MVRFLRATGSQGWPAFAFAGRRRVGVSCICLVFVGSVEMLDRGRTRVRAQRNLGSD